MGRAEKIAQLRGVWGFELLSRGASDAMEDMEFSDERCRERLRDGIGHVSRSVGSTNRGPAGSAEFVNSIQRFLVEETRLGIPAIVSRRVPLRTRRSRRDPSEVEACS
jgi:beta-glucosidase